MAEAGTEPTEPTQSELPMEAPPLVLNGRPQIDHVSPDGRFIYYKGGITADRLLKTYTYKDEAGNVMRNGPYMSKPSVISRAPPQAKEPPPPPIKPGMSKEDAFAQLSDDDKIKAEMFANYQIPITSQYGKMNPDFSRLISYVKLANPDISALDYQRQRQTALQYGSQAPTAPGGLITSANQVVKHLGLLKQVSDQLGGSDYPNIQAVENYLKNKFGYQSITDFNAVRTALGAELARAMQKSFPTVQAMHDWQASIDADLGNAQRRNILLRDIPGLLGGQLESLDAGYEKTMKKRMPINDLIDTGSQEVLKQLGINHFAGRDLGEAAQEISPQSPTGYEKGQVFKNKQGQEFHVGETRYMNGVGYNFLGGDPDVRANWK
jgi:hypothetical protein